MAETWERFEANYEHAVVALGGRVVNLHGAHLLLFPPVPRNQHYTGVHRVDLADGDPKNLLDRALEASKVAGVRPHFYLSPLCQPPHFPALLQARGFSEGPLWEYMVAERPPRVELRPNIRIRRVELEDVDTFVNVFMGAFLEPAATRRGWRSSTLSALKAGAAAYLAERDGRPVGAMLTVARQGVGGLYHTAVEATHRRRGVATALVAQGLEDLWREGNDIITLQVDRGNPARSLYERLGFSVVFSNRSFWTREGEPGSPTPQP